MILKIVTQVKSPLQTVKVGFNKELFLSLNPPFPPVRILEFGGCKQGDRVSLELNFIVFRQKWISLITEDYQDRTKWYFIDEGVQLPFFLKKWRHKHLVESENETKIIDEISYSTGYLALDILMYPVFLLQFWYRKPIYRKYFAD